MTVQYILEFSIFKLPSTVNEYDLGHVTMNHY